jgi:hypothetical protein
MFVAAVDETHIPYPLVEGAFSRRDLRYLRHHERRITYPDVLASIERELHRSIGAMAYEP